MNKMQLSTTHRREHFESEKHWWSSQVQNVIVEWPKRWHLPSQKQDINGEGHPSLRTNLVWCMVTWYTYKIAYIAIHHLPHITSHYFTYSTYSCWHVFGELLTQLEAPWKHWMAAPMAVSNCRTAVDFLSLGSTVLAFLIASSPMCRETKHRKFKGHWINKWWNLKWI